jgi:hypothetical protein
LPPDAGAVAQARGIRPAALARLRRLHDNNPRAYLPVVAFLLAALLAVAAWQLSPARDEAGHAVAAGEPATGGGATGALGAGDGAAGPSGSTVGGAGAAADPVPNGGVVPGGPARVPRAKTSGVFPSGVTAGRMAEVRAWEAYRGSPVDVVVTYSDRSSWKTIISPWMGSGTERFSGFRGDWVISQPLFPESGPEKGNLADCAAGAYNAKWHAFGRWLVAHGRGDSFVRLGWEFNGLWFAWAATDPAHWIQCFRNASSSIKTESPRVRIDWTMNAHSSATPVDAFSLYPGDDSVDVVGIDPYDMYPPSLDAATFDRQCYGTDGLCQVVAFARLHNKLFSVPEWGVVGQSGTRAGSLGQAGGDNPLYIEKMHQVFMRNADILAYEAYFNDDKMGNVRSSLANPVLHPLASAAYSRLW